MASRSEGHSGPGTARLALRGSVGRVWSDLHRPTGAPGSALLVYIPDPAHVVVEPSALSKYAGLAVLAPRATSVPDAVAVTEWVAAHAVDLDADPDRLLVGGELTGAGLAAAVARHARDERWPVLLRQVLIHPPVTAVVADATAATVVTTDKGPFTYAERLRRAGVAVEELAPAPGLTARLGTALRRHIELSRGETHRTDQIRDRPHAHRQVEAPGS